MVSTCYRFLEPTAYAAVVEKAKELGIIVHVGPGGSTILELDANCIYIYKEDDAGSDTLMERFGLNDVHEILERLSGSLGKVISEYDDQFYPDDADIE